MAAAKKTKKRSSGARRKTRIQQQLFRRGGRRRGAGRKSKKARPGRRHARRPDFSARHPLHIVLRVDPAIRTLRRRAMYKAIREATLTVAQQQRIRIVHISLQRLHIHMLVEAADRTALSRGMQGFQIAAARYINGALGRELVHADGRQKHVSQRGPAPRRRGRVFVDRYYAEIITSPTQAHRALQYVLLNWRKHGEDRAGLARTWLVDPFSTGILFPDWLELADRAVMWAIRQPYDPMLVYLPTTWLLKDGWKRIGSISAHTTPTARH